MGNVSKSRRVYDLDASTLDTADRARFVYMDEDNPGQVQSEIWLEWSAWQWMGKPTELTITIEPGDLLNDQVMEEQKRAAGVRVDVACTEQLTFLEPKPIAGTWHPEDQQL